MRSDKKTVAILLNAPALDAEIQEKDVICADGGRKLLRGVFSTVLTVGDFDSLDAPIQGEETVGCPVIKDYTDGEKAVEIAKSKGYEEIVLYGYGGGRGDHVYMNLSLLAFADELGLQAKAISERETVRFYRGKGQKIVVEAKKGDFVSVLPFYEEIQTDESDGLYYSYKDTTLTRTRAVGISNVATKDDPSFRLCAGDALVFVEKIAR